MSELPYYVADADAVVGRLNAKDVREAATPCGFVIFVDFQSGSVGGVDYTGVARVAGVCVLGKDPEPAKPRLASPTLKIFKPDAWKAGGWSFRVGIRTDETELFSAGEIELDSESSPFLNEAMARKIAEIWLRHVRYELVGGQLAEAASLLAQGKGSKAAEIFQFVNELEGGFVVPSGSDSMLFTTKRKD